ncbi:hypothetical protein E1265_14555 [Streptomyces sp. 8K308]|uniref:hypothetical protein n=1 Tax=Streptomyces sp. 8K308 TaxID=2530388 RepID=UPI00104A7521|nr:hypothetical protein [Streptomyces sp. 8K308]TDC22833.1 hypothetical protein E1265_14555 [Streptomyces sp. 8K308]
MSAVKVTTTEQFYQLLRENWRVIALFEKEEPNEFTLWYETGISVRYPVVRFLTVNMDDLSELAAEQEVKTLYTFCVYFKGDKVEEITSRSMFDVEHAAKRLEFGQ